MQNLQIVLTREHQSTPWGFRLKGGAEYNVPLSVLKINPGTPASGKLEWADTIQSIGNYSALYLKHEEALNIIRLFEYHLPLVVKREPVVEANPNASLFWSPSQVPSSQPSEPFNFRITKPGQPPNTNFSSGYMHNLSAGPAWPTNHPNEHQYHMQPQQQQPQQQQPQHVDHGDSPDYKSQYQYQPIYQQSFPIGLQQDGAPPLIVPPPLIRAMTGSSLGKKPFTYTPGGLDLSHIKQSARVKRYENSNTELRPEEQQQQRAFTPSYVDEHGDYQTFMSSESAYMKNKLRPVAHPEDNSGVVSEHLVKPNKHRELINQSTSFRMLNRWIQESEAHPKPVEPEQRRHTEQLLQQSKVLRAIDDSQLQHPESGVDRTSYVKSNSSLLSPYTRLLRLKAQVDRKLGKTPKSHASAELLAKMPMPAKSQDDNKDQVPAGLRYQERDIAKFQGENIPSKTFKYLQYITQEELALEEEERKNKAMMPKPAAQPEVKAQPMRPVAKPQAGSAPTVEVTAPTVEPVVEAAPVEEAPATAVEVAPAPVEEAPASVEEAPVEEVPVAVEETPVPTEVAPEAAAEPVVEAPVEATPVAEASVEAAPVAEVPVEVAPEAATEPVAEAPAQEAPVVVEAAPEVAAESVVEAPVEASPVEEAPVNEVPAPVEEAPVATEAVPDQTPAEASPVESSDF